MYRLAWRHSLFDTEYLPSMVSILNEEVKMRREAEYSSISDQSPVSAKSSTAYLRHSLSLQSSHVPLLQAYLDLRTRLLRLRCFLPQRRPHPNTLRPAGDLAEPTDGGRLRRLLCPYCCGSTELEGKSSEEDGVK